MRALLHATMPAPAAGALFSGMLLAYVAYDIGHVAMHAIGGGRLQATPAPLAALLLRQWSRHSAHHFRRCDRGYGISSPLCDALFGTLPPAAGGPQQPARREGG